MRKRMSSCKTAWRWLTKKDDRQLAYIEVFPTTISKCGANSRRQAKDSALVSRFMTQRFGPHVCSLKHSKPAASLSAAKRRLVTHAPRRMLGLILVRQA